MFQNKQFHCGFLGLIYIVHWMPTLAITPNLDLLTENSRKIPSGSGNTNHERSLKSIDEGRLEISKGEYTATLTWDPSELSCIGGNHNAEYKLKIIGPRPFEETQTGLGWSLAPHKIGCYIETFDFYYLEEDRTRPEIVITGHGGGSGDIYALTIIDLDLSSRWENTLQWTSAWYSGGSRIEIDDYNRDEIDEIAIPNQSFWNALSDFTSNASLTAPQTVLNFSRVDENIVGIPFFPLGYPDLLHRDVNWHWQRIEENYQAGITNVQFYFPSMASYLASNIILGTGESLEVPNDFDFLTQREDLPKVVKAWISMAEIYPGPDKIRFFAALDAFVQEQNYNYDSEAVGNWLFEYAVDQFIYEDPNLALSLWQISALLGSEDANSIINLAEDLIYLVPTARISSLMNRLPSRLAEKIRSRNNRRNSNRRDSEDSSFSLRPGETRSGRDIPDDYRENATNIRPDRQSHILDGEQLPDGTTSGGHGPGRNTPNKNNFPDSWSDEETLDAIRNVVRDPNSNWRGQDNGRYRIDGEYNGVRIRVIYNPSRRSIWTAFPR